MKMATTLPQPSFSSQPAVRSVDVTNVFERNFAATEPIVIDIGGARSSKSHSLAQLFNYRFANRRNRNVLVTRKTLPALKLTAMRLVIGLMQDYGIYRRDNHNKTDGVYYDPRRNNLLAFLSIDDPQKIKSTEWNDVWMEEANEFTWDDFGVVRTRMSGPTTEEEPNQIFLSLNPDEEQGWINQKLILDPSFARAVRVIRSTYRDNPFLDAQFIKILEDLKEQDPVAYQVYNLGEWGALTNVIYSPFELVDRFPDEVDEVIYGLDFGFHNPTALDRIGLRDKLNVYHDEKIYETGLTNSALIARLEEVIPPTERSCPIYADSAEPDRIQEIESAGFYILPADKEVKIGIDFCKRLKHHTLASNVSFNKERGSYKWKQDRSGNVLDEPMKFMDHLMDAMRYALWTHHKGRFSQPGISVIG